MLSANSSLTQKQVREFIQYTAKDLGSPGWDKKYGWGRINAKYAVETAARKFTTSGEMTDKEWWWGTVTVDGDLQIKFDLRILGDANIEVDNNAQITIKEGATLKIESGTEVDFGEDAKLVVEGGIQAGETDADRVNFNFTNETGGIVLNSINKESYIKEVNISNAYWGIKISNCEPSALILNNIEFVNNRIGLKCSNTVINRDYWAHYTFDNNETGIELYNSNVPIYGGFNVGNEGVIKNSGKGINLIKSDLNIEKTVIKDCDYGIDANMDCYVDLTYWESFYRYGYDIPNSGVNNFIENNNNGIHLDFAAGDLSGIEDYPNSFVNNSTDVYCFPAITIDAKYNFWDDGPDVTGAGTVNTSPEVNNTLAKQKQSGIKQDQRKKKITQSELDSIYQAIVKKLDHIIKEYPDSSISWKAMLKMRSIYPGLDDPEESYLDNLEEYRKEYSKKYAGRIAKRFSVNSLMRKGKFDKALKRSNKLLRKYARKKKKNKKGKEKIAWLLFDRAKIKEFLNDDNPDLRKATSAQAKKDLSTIVEEYSQTEAAQHVAERYGMNRKGDTPDQSTPEEFSLDDNYPNPFNPTTNITYQLPKNCRVTLTIYNIRGQKIRTLLDRNMEAGYKSVKWRGRNNAGQRVSSGIYIYKLHTSTGFEKTKKMLLVK